MGIAERLPAPPQPAKATGRIARRRNSGPAAVIALQSMTGNRATAAVLRRATATSARLATPPKKPKTTRKPIIDDAAASRDYANALDYVGKFYAGVQLALELNDKVRDVAQRNYKDFGKLKDPPSLSEEIIKSLFSAVMRTVPGWDLVEKGLAIGLFARDLGRLKLELDEYPIPGYTVEDEERKGPSEATTVKAKKYLEHAKLGWEGASKVYETVVDVLEKRKAAAEAEGEAVESAGLAQQRITDWAKGTAAAQHEDKVVTAWISRAGDDGKLRGGMLAAVQTRLGAIPEIDPNQVDKLDRRYELELYRAKYRHSQYVGTVYTSPWPESDSDPSRPELRVPGGLSNATRRRIAWCAGITATDDGTMASVLGIPTTIERKRNPGLRQAGEY